MKKFYYNELNKMAPREGLNFSTEYYKQTLEQRKELSNFIIRSAKYFGEYLADDVVYQDWAMNTPLKGFKKTGRRTPNRTFWELIEDAVYEAKGKTRTGLPKDFARAPLDRWNRLFKGTDYEFEMIQAPMTNSSHLINYYQHFEVNNATA